MEGPGCRLAVLGSPQGGKEVSQEPGPVSCSPQSSRRGKEAVGGLLSDPVCGLPGRPCPRPEQTALDSDYTLFFF